MRMSIDQKVMRAPDAVCRQEYRVVDGRKHLDAVVWSSKLLGLSVRLPLGLVERPSKAAVQEPALAGAMPDQADGTEPGASGDLEQQTDKRRKPRQERKE